MGFGESAKKWVAEALLFYDGNDASLLPLSLDRFPPNFPRTRVQLVARDTWFRIPEKFPLRDRISQKTVFFGVLWGTLFVLSLWVTGNVLRCLYSYRPLVDIPQIYPSLVTFAEGCTVFQLSTSENHPLPRYQQWQEAGHYSIGLCFSNITRQVAPRDRIADLQWYTNPLHVF